ncbi:hypothetical protein AB9K41_20465 [Cribrihabitans sp. XS_ASV171]
MFAEHPPDLPEVEPEIVRQAGRDVAIKLRVGIRLRVPKVAPFYCGADREHRCLEMLRSFPVRRLVCEILERIPDRILVCNEQVPELETREPPESVFWHRSILLQTW